MPRSPCQLDTKIPSPQVGSETPACSEQIYCTQRVNICCTKSHSCSFYYFPPNLIKTGLCLNIALLSALCLHSSTAAQQDCYLSFETLSHKNDTQFLWGQNKRKNWWPQKPGKHENDPWLPQWDWKFKKGPRKCGRSSLRNAYSLTKCYCTNLRNLCNKISTVKRAPFPQKRSSLLWMTQGFTCNWGKTSCADQFCALHHQL